MASSSLWTLKESDTTEQLALLFFNIYYLTSKQKPGEVMLHRDTLRARKLSPFLWPLSPATADRQPSASLTACRGCRCCFCPGEDTLETAQVFLSEV